ncbi:hypothetical protein [Singulisphaera sp. PoT]|uniref:hypothetical protein n=1 Tax=Singulisphaera sp. PoT TaxID=3411797 RepID=UPI003BF5ADD6
MRLIRPRLSQASAYLSAPSLIAASLIAITSQGCGESAPPQLNQEEFKAVKGEREKIIMREYGAKSFEKGNAPKKKGKK